MRRVDVSGSRDEVRETLQARVDRVWRGRRTRRRLTWAQRAAVGLGVLSAGFLFLENDPLGPVVFLAGAGIAMGLAAVKWRLVDYDTRRPALVVALLDALDVPREANVQVMVDLDPSEVRRKRQRQAPPGVRRYVDPWLELTVPLAEGTVRIRRTEEVFDSTHHELNRMVFRTDRWGTDELVLARSGAALPEALVATEIPATTDKLTGKAVAVLEKQEGTAATRVTLSTLARWSVWPVERTLVLPELYLETLDAMARQLKVRVRPAQRCTSLVS